MPAPAQTQTAVIIAAAGNSQRFGGNTPKQFHPLRGIPLIEHTINLFLPLPEITAIQLVLPPDQLWRHAEIAQHLPSPKILPPAPGGPTRQQSVWHGLQALLKNQAPANQNQTPAQSLSTIHYPLSTAPTIILIHDAARPFTDPALIRAAIQLAQQHGAAILAEPVTDTLKLVGENRTIQQTLDRSKIWRAQTPQAFQLPLLLQALQHAIDNNLSITDEAQAVEQIGGTVHIIPSPSTNLKITDPTSLAWAEHHLAANPSS